MNSTFSKFNSPRFILVWLITSITAYFAVSFLSNVSPNLVFFSLTLPGLFTLAGLLLLESKPLRFDWLSALAHLPALGLTVATLWLCNSFPTLFIQRALFMDSASLPVFIGLAIVSGILAAGLWSAWTRRGATESLSARGLVRFLADHRSGLLLASLFFLTYLALAETINFPGHRTLDQYYDLDISAWLARLTAASPADITDNVRAVHPAVLIFLRPLVGLVSFLLNGDRMQAVFLVHALTASACIFLTWRIVLRISENKVYATIFATFLGASASHLLLGSMLETYIYSAFALLVFVDIIQSQGEGGRVGGGSRYALRTTRPSPPYRDPAILASILVFGITVTNLAQTVILYFFHSPRQIKRIVVYGVLVVASVFLLNLLQAAIYPAADPLTPGHLTGEKAYNSGLFESPWKTRGRILLTVRAISSYSIVAPTPFILTEELGMNVPNFRTFEITIGEFHVAGYSGLADVTAKLWLVLLAAALCLFAWKWFRGERPLFTLGLLACIGFNFALHALYGDDPMLYSPDWVYALVLFVAYAFMPFANRKWLSVGLVVFLALMIFVNVDLLQQIMSVSAPYYGR